MSDVTQAKFQLFSPLPDEEYQSLKQDIRANGVLVPVEIDQNGQTLDGHHRIRAWNELKSEGESLPDYPRVIRSFDNDDDREEHAAKLNCKRRDVSTDDKKDVALKWRQRGWSYRRIGDALGVVHGTVAYWLSKLEDDDSGVQIYTPEMPNRVVGKDGKSYGATAPKPRPKPAAFVTNSRDQERALTAFDFLGSQDDDDNDGEFVHGSTGEILTTTQIRQKAAQREREHRNAEIAKTSNAPMPNGKFRCIVIDPPWPMVKINRDERPDQGKSLDYPVMSLEEIAALPVNDIADDDAHIYLWVTQKFMPAGIELLKSWGFNYQCVMTWVKPTGMTPYSWMYNTEHVLFGRRGSLDLMRMGLKLSFDAPVTRHSAKPDVFYERVVAASPGPRVELFSRTDRDGFVAWGNEATDGTA